MSRAKVISIVSGKGGCGKSLLTAVMGKTLARESVRVLLVDMDIFVRGLTVLLQDFRQAPIDGGRNMTVSGILGVFAENSESYAPLPFSVDDLSIQRFFECDVLQSVSSVSDPLDYSDRSLSDRKFGETQISTLLSAVRETYDYVILDNRAGMDALILASCQESDLIISVAEDDEVGRQTNVNVINYLRFDQRMRTIYTVLNKCRRISSFADISKRLESRDEFSTIGVIPFDIEIHDDFGSDAFWNTVNETLYFRAMIDAWNRLATKEGVTEIKLSRYRFPSRIFMSPSTGRYSLLERMMRVYSVFFIASGMGVWLYSKWLFHQMSQFELAATVSLAIGFISLLLSTSPASSWLMGENRSRNSKQPH